MKKHQRIFETYKRNHKGENFEDSEKSKIFKEKNKVKDLEKRAKKILSAMSATTDDDSLIDEFDKISLEAKKVAGNSNSHKTRLKELQKNDDFR